MKIFEYSVTFNQIITAEDIKNADSVNVGMLEQVTDTIACWHSMTTDGEVKTVINKIRELFPEISDITILEECGDADEYGYCPYLEEISRTAVKINGEEQAEQEQKAEEPTTAEQQTEEQAEPEEQPTAAQQQLKPRKPKKYHELIDMIINADESELSEIFCEIDFAYQHDKIKPRENDQLYALINKIF